MPKVKCNLCGFAFASNAKPENIKAGRIQCKNKEPLCESTDLEIVAANETKPAPPAKGNEQLQSEADTARRKVVDTKNKKAAAKDKSEFDALANTPLTNDEIAFCVTIEPKMNKGRRCDMPCSADILRYSKLKGRMGIKAKAEDGE